MRYIFLLSLLCISSISFAQTIKPYHTKEFGLFCNIVYDLEMVLLAKKQNDGDVIKSLIDQKRCTFLPPRTPVFVQNIFRQGILGIRIKGTTIEGVIDRNDLE